MFMCVHVLQWMSAGKTEASIYQQAEDGKTELSLMHFAITNPHWQPPRESTAFIGLLKERVHRDSSLALAQQAVLPDNALFTSIQSLQSESEVPMQRPWQVAEGELYYRFLWGEKQSDGLFL